MSKAFTRESDDSNADDLPSFRPQLPPGTRNYITRDGANALNQRLNALLTRKEAASATDADKRKLEAAIRNLRQILDSIVIAEIPADRDKVAFGAKVKIRRHTGEEEEYRIVGIDESNPDNGAISWLSPLSRALVSRRAGDKVKLKTPEGDQELTILAVDY
jgi:transcription elongation factor GreB